ncbi:hypothetical protein H112_01528 [Trichophyton rubrum D6]|uniref:Cnl2/NKP2 family protein n=5 Tax=Trichophyton TaxID=5550 RepID=A0A178F7M9_TRIRU|nr:uncharacterized protein TERG_07167 [Trichophyton rubrum CBS 118892]EZF26315.1 hypothetical protein H100_01523 [Trichophyton rubrum MR850]EZF45349.1 hypothetical protein H102_01519 [Trichophyton rubrum CBS 100081]EZF56012.1 hypothetical protein H103_01532 [Trichophyton rubrum CBS 288.86]EZF66597.1 hypothetical protein H104_01508 [Trichophyton rubrum CBS 289.86]EZF77206.1 hypothetical protein H105_01535 [Trichophyton soudanense CBS 452.61]EZF87895.1 hypothetical protein H110_01527 [Trichophy
MAPSEESILTNFLLSPSSLPTVLSLEQFTKLFPRRLQSHPQIRTLYRDLQYLRAQDIDLVQENIQREIKNGEKQKEELRNAQLDSGVTSMSRGDKTEADMDIQLFGQQDGLVTRPEDRHTLQTLLVDMERACGAMRSNIHSLDSETSELASQIEATVGELSDLRYGKLNASGAGNALRDDVILGLKNLEDRCSNAMSR